MTSIHHTALTTTVFALALGAGILAPATAPAAEAATTPYCDTSRLFDLSWATRIKGVASAHTTAGFNCHMAREGRPANKAVMTLQISLNACYGENIAVDGRYGRATEDAVRRAQRAEGFPATQVDGKVGPYSIQHLRWLTTHGQWVCDSMK